MGSRNLLSFEPFTDDDVTHTGLQWGGGLVRRPVLDEPERGRTGRRQAQGGARPPPLGVRALR